MLSSLLHATILAKFKVTHMAMAMLMCKGLQDLVVPVGEEFVLRTAWPHWPGNDAGEQHNVTLVQY